MRAVVVVAMLPVGGHPTDLVEAGEDIAVEHLGSQRSIESLDVCILGGLAGLDVDELDAVLLRPLLQELADQLWPVIEAQPLRCSPNLDQFIQCPDDTQCWQAGVDLDAQRLPVVVIDDVEGPEATT